MHISLACVLCVFTCVLIYSDDMCVSLLDKNLHLRMRLLVHISALCLSTFTCVYVRACAFAFTNLRSMYLYRIPKKTLSYLPLSAFCCPGFISVFFFFLMRFFYNLMLRYKPTYRKDHSECVRRTKNWSPRKKTKKKKLSFSWQDKERPREKTTKRYA